MKRTLLCIVIVLGLSGTTSAQNFGIWGMTQQGGDNDKGIIYNTDIDGDEQNIMHHFDDGEKPGGSLLHASNNLLYGMTSFGGDSDMGVLFSYNYITFTYTKLIDFSGATGGRPRSGLMQASNGMIYGLTYEGGANGSGTIVEFNPSTNTLINVHDFGESSTDPAQPLGGELLEVSPGKMYGLTRFGGDNDLGTLFEFDLSTQTVTKLFDFDGGTSGDEPFGSLIEASNGKLYGLASDGGSDGKGTLFSYDVSSDLFLVEDDFVGNNGWGPTGSLIEATNGLLYGVTQLDSTAISTTGALFSFDPAVGDIVEIQSISASRGSLMQASNGKIFGTNYDFGFFEFDNTTDTYTNKFIFSGPNGRFTTYGHVIEVIASPSTSSIESSSKEVKVYPNPATDQLFIQGEVSEVTLLDLYGQVVLETSSNQIDISTLPAGVYVLEAQTTAGIFSKRLIKK